MTLEFRPPPIQQRPSMADYAQQWNKSLGDIGDTLVQSAQAKRQRDLQALSAAMEAQKNGMDANLIYRAYSGHDAPMVQDPAQPDQSLMPNFQPGQGQMASAGVSDTPEAQVNRPKSLVDVSPWKTSVPPIGTNTPQQPKPRSIFDTKPTDYAGVIGQIGKGDYSGFNNLTEKQKGDLKELPAFKSLSKTESGTNYSADDISDAEKGNWKAIALRNGGKIPSSLATLGESATSKEETAYQKKIADAQNGMINVRGDESIKRTEAQRDAAALAYNTIERVKSEGRMPSKLEYYDLLGQMWKARTGASPTDQALRDLDQKTFQGDLGKAYTYFSGKPAGATTSAVLQNLQDFVAESGVQAEKQHEAYMQPRQARVLNGLKPEDQQKLMNVHRGLSFQEQTGYQPAKTITTKQEYDALPSGSAFIWNGKRAVKR